MRSSRRSSWPTTTSRSLSSNIGLSLPTRADVKIRGVIVGEVLKTTTTGDGAELTLGLYPASIDTIPANVTAHDPAQDAVR